MDTITMINNTLRIMGIGMGTILLVLGVLYLLIYGSMRLAKAHQEREYLAEDDDESEDE